MAGVPIKFRCFHCNQLMGVSRSKAGSVVACPKCSTELIVPAPDEGPAPAEAPSSPETTPAFLAAIAEGLPVELAEIRVEDIRVHPEYPRNPAPVPTRAPAPDLEPIPYVSPTAPFAAPTEVARTPELEPLMVPVAPLPQPQPPPVPVEPALPPIKIEPPSLLNERVPRARDLVLPRSVVAFWSLFVLLAQALAFVAGLLAGHFVWRIH